jgi:hypothetical protein
VTPLRSGRRGGVLDATLSSPDGVVAVQRAGVINPQDYLMDVMEMRADPKGVTWFRAESPIVESGGRMS